MSTLTVRYLNVDLSKGFTRHWMGGDIYRTAFMNALSMSFPLGEQMFIDSVRAVPLETLPDARLRAEVKDFVGQEATHRYVHEQYNDQLTRQGYDYTLEEALRTRIGRIAKLPVLNRLAVTCALEHYTAILSEYLLRHPEFMNGADAHMQTLWNWHAAEETEHKAVAFDVYHAAGGNYLRRVVWYVQVSVLFWADTLRQTHYNLARDGRRFKLSIWASAARTWFGRKGLFWNLLVPGLQYLSPRFHPWQRDNRALLRAWLERNGSAWRAVRSTPP